MSDSGLRLAVTGLTGQVVSAIIARAPRDIEIIALGRPQLELSRRDAVLASLRHARCAAIINAAAYTQVDRAENESELAMRVNGDGAGNVAQAAAELGVPLLHLSTDYVFCGSLDRPYQEEDETNPTSVYGCSKLAGEQQIRATYGRHVILRTAWVYSAYGANFVKTMLRLGADRDEVSVVSDQLGNPTSALDIADALIKITKRLAQNPSEILYGTFHMSGQGEASWADMAQVIFDTLEAQGRKAVKVRRIKTQDYPTPAKRPENSRLDNAKLKNVYGVTLPHWRSSLIQCVEQLIKENA
ncbi:NAD(P)-dependent oxidoreductase [Methylocystaceae bacterium]|nr:NAD(P)-dependent oxidoreductase [Methylocystaceae bacterium]